MHAQNQRSDRLLKVILELCRDLDQVSIVSKFRSVFGTDPAVIEECVVFSDIALKFDERGKLREVLRVVDGTVSRPGEISIQATPSPR